MFFSKTFTQTFSNDMRTRNQTRLLVLMRHITQINKQFDRRLPKLISVDVTQMISDSSGATDRSPVSLSPYLMWKGSIMVTYFLSLIGSAKKSPPRERNEDKMQLTSS